MGIAFRSAHASDAPNLLGLVEQLGYPSALEALRARLEDAAALLESTSGVIENVMSELRPPMLDDYGLLPALQWYATEFHRRTGTRVKVEGDEQMKRLPQTSEIALFRIAQEALNNVAKHAHATHIEIELIRSKTEFIMTVTVLLPLFTTTRSASSSWSGLTLTMTTAVGATPAGMRGPALRAVRSSSTCSEGRAPARARVAGGRG